MAETVLEMRGDLERRIDALETKISDAETHYKKELTECYSSWFQLAGRTLGYAGVWKRQHIVTMGISTVARALDVPVDLIKDEMECIAAAVPDGAGRWQNGRLVMTFPKFAESSDCAFEPYDVITIFERWREAFHPNATLDAARRHLIESRLADGIPTAQVLLAIRGVSSSKWHREKGYTSLALICRDAEHVEKYARYATHGVPECIQEDDESMLDRIGGKT